MSTLRPGAFKVCVQSCQNGQISGQVVAYRLKSPMPFRDTGSLVLSIESVLDAQNFPQAFRRSRSFVPRAVQNPYASDTLNSGMSQEEVDQFHGTAATFLLHVFTRQSSTWQGNVVWSEGEVVRFQSVLELIRILDEHFTALNPTGD